jgi:hypothetical protein
MHVHLALPGLLWPARALPDLVYDLDLPALSWLLGRARRRRGEPLAYEDWLAARFGLDTSAPPLAALRLLGEGADPGGAHWICADPAHLAFEQGQALLADPARLALDAGEIAAIAAALAPALAPLGRFVLRPSGLGYLELAGPAEISPPPLSAALGRGAAALLPRGPAAAPWMRAANEAQIALHALELNRRREAAGRPTVNTLWFWGAGALPTAAGAADFGKVGADETAAPLLRGLARHAGVPWQGQEQDGATPHARRTLQVDERLLGPAQQLDAEAWREGLRALDRERLAPAVAALRGGRLARLTLTALGDEGVLDLEVGRGDALRFWRRPRPLTDLAPR